MNCCLLLGCRSSPEERKRLSRSLYDFMAALIAGEPQGIIRAISAAATDAPAPRVLKMFQTEIKLDDHAQLR